MKYRYSLNETFYAFCADTIINLGLLSSKVIKFTFTLNRYVLEHTFANLNLFALIM